MPNKTSFSCDRCQEKVPLRELFKLNKNSITICKSCNATLYPDKTTPFNWAFFIGFASTVIPAEICYNITNSILYMFSVAAIGGLLAVLGITIYTYKTTEFRS
jgi:hypothetical protein